MMVDGKLHVGIGFATGRKNFQNVLRSYIFHLHESQFLSSQRILLSLFVAFDPTYMQMSRADYERLSPEILANFHLVRVMGPDDIEQTQHALEKERVLDSHDFSPCFGNGYAAQRNIILYQAMCDQVDYLIFFDDDEYPMAVTQSRDVALWSGQHVIENHVKYLQFADFTNGYHCGYLSPLPSIEFDAIVDERIFRQFIEALSSDVLQWDSVIGVMRNGGVTYADKEILIHQNAELVDEIDHAKFITGGNLGMNLTDREKVLSFYNPPGARGEDSFLSTCLCQHTVKRIPTYTFHDGFSIYETLLNGVLPTNLRNVSFYDSNLIIERFYRACIGWIRYKPLYTYLTCGQEYRKRMEETHTQLEQAIPRICAFFNNRAFEAILHEMDRFTADVNCHAEAFERSKMTWEKLKQSILQHPIPVIER